MHALSARFAAARLFAVMLLMTIGLQALVAQAPDAQPVRGSAFGVGTTEMAILTVRQDASQPVRFVPPPALPPIRLAIIAGPANYTAPQSPALRPDSRAPPAAEWLPADASPRAPPAA